MKHDKYRELIFLASINELSEEERRILENHLLECEECAAEAEESFKVNKAFAGGKREPLSDKVLADLRKELMRNLKREKTEREYKSGIWEFIKDLLMPNYKFALGGAALLAAGVFFGYLFFAGPRVNTSGIVENSPFDLNKYRISNLRVSNMPGAASGEMELSFDVQKHVTYRGTVDDPFTKDLLAASLFSEENPGLRITTMNTIASRSDKEKLLDPKIKRALISTLMTDQNPGVRREALSLLNEFDYDIEIRDAFLFVLSNDSNSGLRILAINSLSGFTEKGIKIDDEIRKTLNGRAESDENDFVRLRAANLLMEEK